MKRINLLIILLSVFIASQFLLSCKSSADIAKRKHRQGYYVGLSKKKNKNIDKTDNYSIVNKVQNKELVNNAISDKNEDLIASNDNKELQNTEVRNDSYLEKIPDISIKLNNYERTLSIKKLFHKKPYTILSENEPPKKVPWQGIASLVMGILSILGLATYVLGIPFGILALVWGFKSNKLIEENPEIFRGKGYGIAGIIMGSIGLVLGLLVLLLIAFILAVLISGGY